MEPISTFDVIISFSICPFFFLLFLSAAIYDCYKHRNDPPEFEMYEDQEKTK